MEKTVCPKISVIMTTYQAQKHLKKSIGSVLKQSLREIELVCIDGRSTDRTVAIIEELQKRDPRIRLYQQDKQGIGAAKNCGIARSEGEYITFLDADDYYVDPHALERMYQVCVEKQADICGALRTTLYADGSVKNEPLHRSDVKGHKQGVLLKYADRQYDYHFHSYLYKRSMIMESDARFAEVSAYDDTHFFIRAMLRAGQFYVVPVELYRYRCGAPYDWGSKKAEDAMAALTDQLKITAQNHLEQLHWLTLQRINYEYGVIFEKNVRAGNMTLFRQLLEANDCIDVSVIDRVEREHMRLKWYVKAMMHKSVRDMPLRTMQVSGRKVYIAEPVWRLLHMDGSEEMLKKQNEQLSEEIGRIKSSYAFKIGNAVLYVPRRVRRIFRRTDRF